MQNIYSKLSIIFIFLFLFPLFYLLCPLFAFASIEIDPMRIELELNKGQSYSGYITITNRGNENYTLSFSCGEYRYMFSDNTLFPKQKKIQKLPSCQKWISLKPEKIPLDKNQQIQYTIKMPANISNSEYLAAILIDEERSPSPFKPDKSGQVKIKITPRIIIPVYVTIKKSLKRNCRITELTCLDSKDKKSLQFFVTLKNTGTTHIRPATIVTILDADGALVNKIKLGKSLPLFSGFGEKLYANWTPPSAGRYMLIATVDIETEQLIQKSIAFEVKE